MSISQSTCWTVIHAAAAGSPEDREQFARRYEPLIRSYLAARWRGSPCLADLKDAVQEVFVDCFKQDGVLHRADPGRGGGFRPFLYGVVRIVALRFESRRRGQREHQFPNEMDLEEVAGSEDDLADVFDRAWAKNLFREAAQLQQQRALKIGGKSWQRVELLRLRFQQGMPIREIARDWQVEAAEVHHEYAKARQEFKEALLEVMAFHHQGTPAEIEEECTRLAAFWS